MKNYILLFVVCFIAACSKKDSKIINNNSLNVEDFRRPGMDDYETIQAAVNSADDNAYLFFASRTYVLSHTVAIQKNINFRGPATITRENQITYLLKEPAYPTSTYLILNSTTGLRADADSYLSDYIVACVNKTGNGSTANKGIVRVNGDTVFLADALGTTEDGKVSTFPSGTRVFKNIILFWVVSPARWPKQGWYPDLSCSFSNLIFDGNRKNNTGTYYWNINSATSNLTKAVTTFSECAFQNSPNETIVGHNAKIVNCIFKDLNGSAFHTSGDKENCTEDELHSEITSCIFENTNQIRSSVTGHSEGCITHSNSGGYYTATNNIFKNVGESLLGMLYASVSPYDWGTNRIHFSNNIIDGVGRIVYGIDMRNPGLIHDVFIGNNKIANMEVIDFSNELTAQPNIHLEQGAR